MRGLWTLPAFSILFGCGDLKLMASYRFQWLLFFGVNFVSGQRGRALRYNKNTSHPNYGERSWLPDQEYGQQVYLLRNPDELDVFDQEAFAKSQYSLYAVATNVETGAARIFQIDRSLSRWKSCGPVLPCLWCPKSWNGRQKYLDVTSRIRFQWNLPKSGALTSSSSSWLGHLVISFQRTDLQGALSQVSQFLSKVAKRYQHYNDSLDQIEELEKTGTFCHSTSKALEIGRLEKNLISWRTSTSWALQDGEKSWRNWGSI